MISDVKYFMQTNMTKNIYDLFLLINLYVLYIKSKMIYYKHNNIIN